MRKQKTAFSAFLLLFLVGYPWCIQSDIQQLNSANTPSNPTIILLLTTKIRFYEEVYN